MMKKIYLFLFILLCSTTFFYAFDKPEMYAEGSISVPEGEKAAYQYRFKYTFADNSVKYDNDWDAERYIANPFGGENSVFSAVRE